MEKKKEDKNPVYERNNSINYGLNYSKKIESEKVLIELSKKFPSFKFLDNISSISNEINNILFQGDNLHFLTLLNILYPEGLADVIYIDPPYNTGNKDFIYNDSFVDLDDPFRHSKWLNFMEKRLTLARNILKEKGIIFISIDDHEQANLKLLCDKIYGEKNFIQMFLWNKSSGGSSLSKFSRTDYEYILCYAKRINEIDFEFLGSISEGMGDSSLINKPNKKATLEFPEKSINFPNIEKGAIKAFSTSDLDLYNDIIIEGNVNLNKTIISAKWKWSQAKLDLELSNKTKIISKSNDLRLRYIKNNSGDSIKPTKSITIENGVGYTVTGTSDLEKLIGENKFSYPKPVNLIEYLIRMVTHKNKDAVIVDFFAGSGTTAEAVFKLNNEDKGKRRFLICTNNENNICQSITIPRVSIALNKYFKLSNTLFNPNLIVLEQDFIELSESTEQSKYNLQINIENIIAMYEETFLIIKKNDYYTSYKNFREDKIVFIYKNFYNKKQFNNMIEEIGKFKIKVILYVYDNDIEELINSSNIVNILYIKTFKEKYFDRYKSIIDEIKWG